MIINPEFNFDSNLPLSEYPRPQFKRDSYFCLNGLWDIKIVGDSDVLFDGKINVPYSPESDLSGVCRQLKKDQTLVYSKTFTLPENFNQGVVLLNFGACDQETIVSINGKMVGELSPELTITFNAINTSIAGTSLAIKDVPYENKTCNYLLSILNDKNSIKVKATNSDVELDISLSLFCKVADVDTTDNSESLSANLPLSKPLIDKTKELLYKNITEVVNTSVQTDCDFLRIKEKLYRFNYSKYSLFKDNFLSKLKLNINLDVRGQR